MLKAALRLFLQAAAQNPLQRGRKILHRLRQRGRLFVQNRAQRFGGGGLPEGAFAGEHLVQDHAESKDVAARVGGMSPHLLRRHVADGTGNLAGLGVLRDGGGRTIGADGFGLREFGQAEIQDLEAAVFRQEEVFRFEVTMYNAGVVSGGQSTRNVHSAITGIARTHRTAAQAIPQCFSLQQFGHYVRTPIVLSDVEDRNNIGMVESGSGLRLQFEAVETSRVPRPVVWKHFDRHVTFQRGVACAIHFAHSARAQRRDDLIGIQPRARDQSHESPKLILDRYSVSCPRLGESWLSTVGTESAWQLWRRSLQFIPASMQTKGPPWQPPARESRLRRLQRKAGPK